ncbi:MAG: 2-oxo acid dehydrogenase subunit E2 [Spirochaetia bacterium]|nr:2-oxo acid dehydrogenase subunit E2 [Spirochaetia bacterium]
MATEILMPQLGLTMTEGLIMEWKKREGEKVSRGEVLFSVENDKATIDVSAQADGVLARILVPEMVTVPVGSVVGIIAGENEAVPAPAAAPGAKKPETTVPATSETIPASGQSKPQPELRSSPYARVLADAEGINLETIRGTGPEGAIIARDIPLDRRPQEQFQQLERMPPIAQTPIAQQAGFVDINLTRIQSVAAERMAQSWETIPQFTLYDEADAAAVQALAERFKSEQKPVSLTVILAKLLAHTAVKYPLINAVWLGGGKVRTYRDVMVNIAMDTSEGLVVPVLPHCAATGFAELGRVMKDLSERAKNRSLTPADYEGGTITLSNLGMFGIKRFRAIINPPQTAILAVGAISPRLLPSGSGYVSRNYIEFSLTADHRVVDGAYAARALAHLRNLIENPLFLLD